VPVHGDIINSEHLSGRACVYNGFKELRRCKYIIEFINLSISERGNEQMTTLCSRVGVSRNREGPQHNNPSSNNLYGGLAVIGGRQRCNIYKLDSPHNMDDKTPKIS
jgi:hypothetical protein